MKEMYKRSIEVQTKNSIQEKVEHRKILLQKESSTIFLHLNHIENDLDLIAEQIKYLFEQPVESFDVDMNFVEDPLGFMWEPYTEPRKDSSNIFISQGAENISTLKKELPVIKEMDTIFRTMYRNTELIDNIWFAHANSAVITYPSFDFKSEIINDRFSPDIDITTLPFFSIANPKNNPKKELKWTDPYNTMTFDSWVTSATKPVYSNHGRFLGVVGVDFPLKALSKRILKADFAEKGTLSFIMNDNNEFIAGNHDKYLEADFEEQDIIGKGRFSKNAVIDTEKVYRLIKGKTQKYFLLENRIPSTNWTYVLAIPEKEITRPIAVQAKSLQREQTVKLLWVFLGIGLLTFIILLFLSYYLSKYISYPIRKLKDSISQFVTGNFEHMTYNETSVSRDEVGELTLAFYEMESSMSTLINELRERTFELEASHQKLKLVDQSRTELIAQMSHDLKTPLTSLKGFISILQQFDLETESREKYLKTMDLRLNHVISLINDLIENYSTLETGDMSFYKEETVIEELINHSIELCYTKMDLSDSNVEIIKNYPGNLPLISVDQRKMNQVFVNLISNAIKYSSILGQIRIMISLHVSDDYIYICIEDNGIGIETSNLPKIFDKFYREPRSAKQFSGSGLGLSIVKKIVEGHKGFIEVNSVVGEGTMFEIKLPLNT